MICNKCHTEGVENQVMGQKFFYCRTCKIEIIDEPIVAQPTGYADKETGGFHVGGWAIALRSHSPSTFGEPNMTANYAYFVKEIDAVAWQIKINDNDHAEQWVPMAWMQPEQKQTLPYVPVLSPALSKIYGTVFYNPTQQAPTTPPPSPKRSLAAGVPPGTKARYTSGTGTVTIGKRYSSGAYEYTRDSDGGTFAVAPADFHNLEVIQ